ncbi:hypothetical protein BRC90_02460 [Halobacteriales archaeon QS_4_69_34]|nr:MAG: hypothetical protein BRC90_02460 [Halobacteriales archaeon QS_4_69_34]
MNLYEYFARQVDRRPDVTAVAGPDGRDLTYAGLDAQSESVAAWLDARTDAGDRVAVYMMDSPTYVAAVLGAWRAGCAVTPVNYRFGSETVEYVLDDAGARVLLVDDAFAGVGREAGAAVGSVEHVAEGHADGEFRADAFGDPADAPIPATRFDDDTAVVMHTSGTTGRPKGVAQTHRNVGAQVDAAVGQYGLSAADTAVVAMPLFHVGGLHGAILMGLFTGGTVVIQPAWDAAEWARLVDATGATLSGLVPAMIVDVLDTDTAHEFDTASLRLCFYGGSPAPEPVLREFAERFEVGALVDYYGQTEVAGLAVTDRAGEARTPGAMGRPIPALEARVVDLETGVDVPDGEEGELLLRGDTVMDGYWERPARTAESTTDGWLHTDDVVVRNEDGLLHYVDRVDEMILSGGEKVSPSAVENALADIDGVETVAVLGTPHDRLGEAVTAAVVRADESLAAADVEAFCESRADLAGYEKPRRVVFVESLPRTGSQKVDKGALAERLDGAFA